MQGMIVDGDTFKGIRQPHENIKVMSILLLVAFDVL